MTNSIANYLLTLNNIKKECRLAIINKQVNVLETESFTLYPSKISMIKQVIEQPKPQLTQQQAPISLIQQESFSYNKCKGYDKYNKNSLVEWSCAKRNFHYGY